MEPHPDQILNLKIKFILSLIKSIYKSKNKYQSVKEMNDLLDLYFQEIPLYFSVILLFF